jgi:hypothetical protein
MKAEGGSLMLRTHTNPESIHASTHMQHHFYGLYIGIQTYQPIIPKDIKLTDQNINGILYLNLTVMHYNAENQQFVLAI